MLDALRALGCAIEQRRRRDRTVHRPRRRGSRCAQAELLPRQRRHRDAAAGRGAGAARDAQGGDFELRGVAAHARAADRRPGRCAAAARLRDRLPRRDGYPAAAHARPPAARCTLDAPIRVRGDVSSQFLTALLLALPLAAARSAIVIEVDGELISKPYVEITLNLLRALRHRRSRSDGWQRFTIPPGSRYRSPGSIHVEGDASSASYFIALGAIAARRRAGAHRGRGRATRSRATSASSTRRRRWARSVAGGAGWLEVRARRAGRCRPSTLDCNHIPDAAMTLAVMALYADGTDAADATSPAGASRRPTASPRWPPSCASSAPTVDEGADFLERRRRRAAGAPAAIDTYDDHRMAMCFSLAAFNAGAACRCASATRSASPRPSPTTSRRCSASAAADAARDPGDHGRRPDRVGQGHAGLRAWPRALGYHHLDSGALYRATALAAHATPASPPTTSTALAGAGRALRLRFDGGRVLLGGATSPTRCAPRRSARSPRGSRRCPRCARRCSRCSWRSAALPGLVADGRDMGTVVFPDAQLKVFLTASAAERAERRHKQLISKGISANIDDSSRRPRGARRARLESQPSRP